MMRQCETEIDDVAKKDKNCIALTKEQTETEFQENGFKLVC